MNKLTPDELADVIEQIKAETLPSIEPIVVEPPRKRIDEMTLADYQRGCKVVMKA